MKHNVCAIISLLSATTAFATPPVTLSGPVPAISQAYTIGTSTTVIYTVKNNVPKTFPLSVSGISNGVSRTQVANDCNNTLPAGSSCNIGILINPSASTSGSSVNQTLQINYQARTALTSRIAFATSQLAYATLIDQVSQYSVNPANGLLSSGITTVSNTAVVLAFTTVGNVQYAYVTDQGASAVYRCSINNADGTFNSCVSAVNDGSLSGVGAAPRGIAFATINGTQYGYITDISNSVIFQCFFNTNLDGLFDTCTQQNPVFTSGAFSSPVGISFGTVGSNQYAYIADVGVPSLFQCSLNTTGSVTSCTPTPSVAPNWAPGFVILKTTLGTPYAYVANEGGGGFAAAAIYKCAVNNDGTLSSACTVTPTIDPPSGINWAPGYIAFATFSGVQYVYIASANGSVGGGIYRCVLNNAGEFQDCQFTGGPFAYPPSYPISVAFRFS